MMRINFMDLSTILELIEKEWGSKKTDKVFNCPLQRAFSLPFVINPKGIWAVETPQPGGAADYHYEIAFLIQNVSQEEAEKIVTRIWGPSEQFQAYEDLNTWRIVKAQIEINIMDGKKFISELPAV